nr:retrovirus-related Pol polyprotein from transposon TNT 1-94 [Tanacetum cinerariifolium]
MGKTIVELHAMLKLHEKGIPKKAETPVVLAIREDNCHFAPTVIRGVVSISRLVENGYIHTFKNYGIFVSKDDVFYFNVILYDGIYEIDMHILYPNVSSTFNVSNKRIRSIKCIFVGYPKETMSYYFYYPPENKIFVAQNAEFFENRLIVQEASGSHGLLKISESDEGLEIIQEEDTQPSENTSEEHNEVVPIEVEPQNVKVPICRFEKIPQAPDRYGFYVDVDEYELGDLNEPHIYKVALSYAEYDKWLKGMNMKMHSMKDNQVWILVELHPNGQTVKSKWIFKKKTDMDENVHTFKDRLVAKGYTQTYGVDYRETFSPVTDIRAIRILLAIAAFYDYEIWQMVVKTTFLNGHLSEDVCMVQPDGFVDPKHPNKVCKLQRFIYGLKQESRSWNKSQSAYLEKILKKFRMENSKKGYSLMIEKPYYKKSQGAKTPSEVQHIQIVLYASAISSIMYAVRGIRPNVAFAQNLCCRFQQKPSEIYWTAVKTILKYLKNTKDMVLMYGAKPEVELKVSCYADASFRTDKDDTKSETGYVFVLNGGAIDWKSANDVVPLNKRPIEMLCDNEPAIAIVANTGIAVSSILSILRLQPCHDVQSVKISVSWQGVSTNAAMAVFSALQTCMVVAGICWGKAIRVLTRQYDWVLAAMAGRISLAWHDSIIYLQAIVQDAFPLCFYGDDDNCFGTAWDALSTSSWHDDHTHVVVASMSSVLYHPVFATISICVHCHDKGLSLSRMLALRRCLLIRLTVTAITDFAFRSVLFVLHRERTKDIMPLNSIAISSSNFRSYTKSAYQNKKTLTTVATTTASNRDTRYVYTNPYYLDEAMMNMSRFN